MKETHTTNTEGRKMTRKRQLRKMTLTEIQQTALDNGISLTTPYGKARGFTTLINMIIKTEA